MSGSNINVSIKRSLGLLVFTAIIVVFICLIMTAKLAYAAEVVASGTCDSTYTMTWTLDDEGVLTITGSGEMQNYSYVRTLSDGSQYYNPIQSPWYDYNDSITAIIIGDGVTNIGDFAFKDITNSNVHLELPNTLERIGYGAFLNSSGITGSLELPSSLTYIGDAAFYGCTGLTGDLILPDNITSIKRGTFYGCTGLGGSLHLPSNLKSFDTKEESAFGINTIWNTGAFKNCAGFKGELELPTGLEILSSATFQGCTGFESITWPDSLERIGGDEDFNYSELHGGVFQDCSGIKGDLRLPNSVTTIGMSAFAGCSQLEGQLLLPKALQTIGRNAFTGCKFTGNLVIPDNTTSIGSYAFYNGKFSSIKVGCSVTSIDDYAFCNNDNLTTIIIPEEVQHIGYYAFGSFISNSNKKNIVYTGRTFFVQKDSYADTYFKSNKQYLLDPLPKYDTEDYLLFRTACINVTKGDVVSLSEYLVSDTDIDYTDASVITSDESVAFYSDGEIAGVSVGECTLTVDLKGKQCSTKICVINSSDDVPLYAISFNEDAIEMLKGNSSFLLINFQPINTTHQEITWSSSDESIVSVDSGIITAKKAGVATITAQAGEGITDSCIVTVKAPLLDIVLPDSWTIIRGTSESLCYYLYPIDTTNTDEVSFTSSNDEIVSVSEDGIITGIKTGNAHVEVSAGSIKKTISITVYSPLKGLSLDQSSIMTACGDQIQLTPKFDPEDASEKDVTWSSNKESVATVDNNGLVTVHAKGIATITATAGEFSATCSIVCNAHNWGEGSITTEPTCTEEGVKTFTCVCGESYTEVIPAKGHIWNEEYTTDKAATCKEEGSKSIHCSVCDAVDESTVTVIPKADHTYGDWTVTAEATCTEDGSKEKVCSVCEDKVTEVIPAKGHTWNEEYTTDKEPTCTEEGSKSIHCSVCGAINETTVASIPMTDHTYGDWTVTKEATCTVEGSKEKTCTECGHKVTEAIPAKGHVWNEDYTIDKAATCTEEGSKSIHCSVCGAIDETTVTAIQMTDHTFGDWETTIEAKCETPGEKQRRCDYCGLTETEVIAALDHDWGEWTVVKEATEDEEGLEVRTCSRDASHSEERVIPKLGHTHDLVRTDAVAASCTADGNIEYWTCSKCRRIYSDPEGTVEIDKEDTVIKATGHTEEVLAAVAPTCTESGLTEGKKCSVCGEILVAQETVAALGHTEEVLTAVAPTCTETGLTEGKKCSVCGEILVAQETVAALGHDYHEVEGTAIAATCTTAGKNADQKCSRCDSVIEGAAISALGHTWDEGTVTQQPTTAEPGIMTYTCTVCGETYTEEIPVITKTGWIKEDGFWYYYSPDGTAVTGWLKDGGKWYYLDASGVMQTKWVKISGKWYYFNSSGVMQTGWQKISSKQYFFKSSGAMAANEWVKGYYWLNKDGTWTYKYKASWKKSGSKWWFGDTSGWYAKNTTITIDGKKYTFDKKGYLV